MTDLESVNTTLKLIEKYGSAAEAKLNIGKTQILLCGTSKAKKPNTLALTYTSDKIKLLGVWTGNSDASKDNWTPVVNKAAEVLGMWSQRDPTVKGKAVVANVMGLSKK